MYSIRTHDGRILSIKQDNPEIIKKLAKQLELVAVTLATGDIIYVSKGNVARIEKSSDNIHPDNRYLLESPNYKGTNSEAKERVRQKLKEKGIL